MSVKIKKSPLTLDDRIVIEIRYRYGYSEQDIAKELNRNPSTIYREIDGKLAQELESISLECLI